MITLFRRVGWSEGWRRMGYGRSGRPAHTNVYETLNSRHPAAHAPTDITVDKDWHPCAVESTSACCPNISPDQLYLENTVLRKPMQPLWYKLDKDIWSSLVDPWNKEKKWKAVHENLTAHMFFHYFNDSYLWVDWCFF